MFILYSILTALCLCIGFYFGFILGKTNELPKRKTRQEKVQAKEEEKKTSEFEKALGNLDRFDGSSQGQEEI